MRYLTRKDTDVGVGEYDSIQWLFDVHLKRPDTHEYNFALLHGNEDSPQKIELWREEPDYNTRPDVTWLPEGSVLPRNY